MINEKVIKGQYGFGFPVITVSQKEYLNKGAEVILKALEPVGKAVTKVVAALPSGGPTTMPYFPTTVEGVNRERQNLKMREKAFEEHIAPALSPSNHIVAWTQGSMNPKVGLRKIGEWGPLALLGSLGVDIIGFKYVPKGVKTTIRGTKAVVNKAIDRSVIRRSKNIGNKINISPQELFKALRELKDYYFLGHGTGRTGVNPLTIFDNGLRVKSGDISNTTMPISESNLTSWPHMNSEEIIIMPGKAAMTKYDSAHGHIPSDWYSDKVFHWTDNPKKIGSGPFAAFEPNASFTEQTIGGVPGVYTKPEAVLGSYNTKTHTLRLNPRSQYKFTFKSLTVDKKKKGGKTHKPWGHRSILDNGWLSTKLLKNKKNVYGK